MQKPKISILLAAYKSADLLKKVFIPSLQNCSVDCEVVVCDNGGNDLASNGLDKQFSFYSKNKATIDWVPLGSGENIGLNQALNICAEVASGNYFYLLHTDMYLMPGWDTALLDASKNLPPASFLLCSRSIEKSSHIPMQILKDFGTNLDNFNEKGLYEFFEKYHDNGIVTGCRMPMFFHKKLWEKLESYNLKNFGKKEAFDSNYFSYATDNEMIINSYEVGVRRFWMINKSVVYHLSGHSNKQQSVDRDDEAPYDYLRNKWKKFGHNIGHIDTFEQALFPWNIKIR